MRTFRGLLGVGIAACVVMGCLLMMGAGEAMALRGGPLAALSPVEQPFATTDVVTNCSDSSTPTTGSLRYEVANASAGDTIAFALPSSCNGLITLTAGAVEIAQNLTIDGPGASALAVSGNETTTVFAVDSGITAAISGLTIEDGKANQGVGCQGGGIYNSGTLTVTDATLSDNSSPSCGGGGIFNNGGTLTITDSTLSGNSDQTGGGGIYSESGSVTLTDSILSGNSGGHGAGIDNASGTVTLTGSTVSHSALTGAGAGIYNSGTLNVTDGSTVSDNAASGAFGGGIWNGGTLNVTDSTVSGNRALNEAGGGIANDGTATIADSTLSGNSAPGYGGGILNENTSVDPAVNVTGSTLSGNSTGSWGGGIAVGGGTANVTASTLSGNSAASDGGGIANFGGVGSLSVTHSTLSGNTAAAGDAGGSFIGSVPRQSWSRRSWPTVESGWTALAKAHSPTAATTSPTTRPAVSAAPRCPTPPLASTLLACSTTADPPRPSSSNRVARRSTT